MHEPVNHFAVIHPLDDVREEKVDTENPGPMAMTASVRIPVLSLRASLVLMLPARACWRRSRR